MISFHNDRLIIDFRSFDLQSYDLFLKSKAIPEAQVEFNEVDDTYKVTAPSRFAAMLGVESPKELREWLKIADYLFDYQKFIIEQALACKRYAIWADCGLGKTAMFLEWARQVMHRTGGKVLIFAPLQVIQQHIDEARKFYGDTLHILKLETREELIHWCKEGSVLMAICNPEKMISGVINELRLLSGVVLDESSLLKSGGGVIKWNLIKSCRGIEYKLSCTATPAPNDTMEYASQAAFLEKLRNEGEILWTYFQRDKAGNWRIKPHAYEAFFKFMSSWSIYLRSPGRYGWTDNMRDVPEPQIHEYRLQMTEEQAKACQSILRKGDSNLLISEGEKLGVTQRTKLSQIAKGFIYDKPNPPKQIESKKPQFVADLIKMEIAAGRQILVWTVFDEETAIIEEHCRKLGITVAVLSGKTKETDRLLILEAFRKGEIRVLISKASMLGYGLNFQFCSSMIFSGWNDSYEQWYQAVRRAYRYGQTQALQVHIPYIHELEGLMYENILRKKAQFESDTALQEENYIKAMKVTV